MIIKNDFDGKEVKLCDCECEQVVVDTQVDHIKRNYYEIHYSLVCIECDSSWMESIYLVAKGRDFSNVVLHHSQ